MKVKRRTALIVVASLALSSCANMTAEQKEQLGKYTGAATGAAAALLATGGKSTEVKVLAALAGAAAGAYIGGQFAKALNEKDREELYKAQQEAAATGQTIEFQGSEPGVSGKVSVVEGSVETDKDAEVQVSYLKDRVESVPPLELVGAPYMPSSGAANVRVGPGTDYKKVSTVPASQAVQVIGKVENKDWLLISESPDGSATGFVYSKLMVPASQPAQYTESTASLVASSDVAATRVCKTVRQEVTTSSGTINEDIRVCQQGDGTWKLA